MTQQELIAKLQELKQIKPKQEWVALSKMSILNSDLAAVKPLKKARFSSIFSNFSPSNYRSGLVYSLAAFLLLFAGIAGVLTYGFPSLNIGTSVAKQSTNEILAENTLKSNVEVFKAKSEDLTQAMELKSSNIPVAIKEAKDATKNLTDAIEKNPELAGTVALEVNNDKTLLDVQAGSASPDVTDLQNSTDELEGAVVGPLIKDEEKISLTPDEETAFKAAQAEYNKGDNGDALRDMLLLQKSSDNTTDGPSR